MTWAPPTTLEGDCVMVKSMGSETKLHGFKTQNVPLISCGTSGSLFNLSVPQFLH